MHSPASLSADRNSLSRVRERAGVRVRARALRQQQTTAETLLWSRLRNRQLQGFKFRRQHPVADYFADFACLEASLVIELDGGQHADAKATEYDARRTAVLEAEGFRVLRFWNHEVMNNIEGVLQTLLQSVQQGASALTPPSPACGRGSDPRQGA